MTRYIVAAGDDPRGGPGCAPLANVLDVLPASEPACIDCLHKNNTRWLHLHLHLHLRQCLTCGLVRCCDDSPRRHATAHRHASGHPLIRSFEPGESWAWCYADQLLLVPADERAD